MNTLKKKILLVGEPMGLFIAQQTGALENVSDYTFAIAGAEFNVAVGMQRLGHKTGYFTKLGNDPFGKRVINTMNQNNISTDLIVITNEKTTGFMLKSKVESGDPNIYYYRKNSAASTLCKEDIETLDVSKYDAVHITGITPALNLHTREATIELVKKTRANNMTFTFDPNLRPQLWESKEAMIAFTNLLAGYSDIFMPGINEAEILCGSRDPDVIADYYLSLGTKILVLKLGPDGSFYATSDKRNTVKGYKVANVVDTVGAGDGFAAGLLSALREGLSLDSALDRGNAVGAIQVMSVGDNDGLPSRKELELFMSGNAQWRTK